MNPRRRSYFEKLRTKCEKLIENIDLYLLDEDLFFGGHYWTPFKLLFLLDFCQAYLKILRNQSWVEKLIYFDPMCGPGINKISQGRTRDFILGSPLIALKSMTQDRFFDVLVFNDLNDNFIRILEDRINVLNENNPFLNDLTLSYNNVDCNLMIQRFIESIPENSHSLVFLDPLTFEITWESMVSLLNIPCDIIFLFVTQNIKRTLGSAQTGNNGSINALNTFFGLEHDWNSIETRDLVDIYKNQLEENNKIVKTYEIKGRTINRTEFQYHIFVIVKPTESGNPWLRIFDQLGTTIEQLGPNQRKIFDIITGRQNTIDQFFD